MKRKKGVFGTLAFVSLLLLAGAANAAPIKGDITFFGVWQAQDADGVDVSSCCLGIATRIAFVGDVLVSQAIGDFDGAAGLYAPYTDFTFDPFEGPIASLWTLTLGETTFSFSLEGITVGLQTPHQLALQGYGILSATGYDDTQFAWSFSGDHTGALLSFSAASYNVPEPSVVGLLGLGLIAMGAVGVRRRREARRV